MVVNLQLIVTVSVRTDRRVMNPLVSIRVWSIGQASSNGSALCLILLVMVLNDTSSVMRGIRHIVRSASEVMIIDSWLVFSVLAGVDLVVVSVSENSVTTVMVTMI